MNIQCSFDYFTFPHGDIYYRCFIKNKIIPENVKLMIIGRHVNFKTNDDITHVKFEDCSLTRVPQGHTKIFPNMRSLSMQRTKLKKIRRIDLVEYKNIEKFICADNEIEYLPEDLFDGFKNLSWIGLFQNKLKLIEPGLLDDLTKLKYIDISSNPNYNVCYSVYHHYESTHSSVEAICEQLLRKYPNLELKKKIHQLKAENQESKAQKGILKDLTAFIEDETTKDFKIIINAQEFPVHKFLLAARSPTLAEILKNNPEVENLNLVDISVEIFEIILKFLYTDELPDNDSNFLHLFAAAGKLKIEELKNHAATKLIDQIDEDNALDLLKVASKYNHNELKINAFNFMKEAYPEIDFKDEWMENHLKLTKVMDAWKKKKDAMLEIEKEFKRILMTD